MAFKRSRIKFESSAHPFITLSPLFMPCMPFAADHKRIKVVIERIVGEWPYNCLIIFTVSESSASGRTFARNWSTPSSVRGVKGIIEKTRRTVGNMARNTKKATLDANNLALVCRYIIDISMYPLKKAFIFFIINNPKHDLAF
jgi:hypothetical protein